jgi:pentose-5-phosphate-3-epimerase
VARKVRDLRHRDLDVAHALHRMFGAVVEVDGGIDAATGPDAAAAGTDWFVAGSAIFGNADPAAAYREIADAVGAG